MRSFIFLAAVMLLLAAAVPKLLERAGALHPAQTPASIKVATAVAPPSGSTSARSLTVEPDRQGHFRVDARVDGRRLGFMIDTGATLIALTQSAAGQLGVHPMHSDFTASVKTANGTLRAAPTQLGMVEIGDIMVRDVPALVLPDEALSENLLGLSFLSRLHHWEYASGKLVLEQ